MSNTEEDGKLPFYIEGVVASMVGGYIVSKVTDFSFWLSSLGVAITAEIAHKGFGIANPFVIIHGEEFEEKVASEKTGWSVATRASNRAGSWSEGLARRKGSRKGKGRFSRTQDE